MYETIERVTFGVGRVIGTIFGSMYKGIREGFHPEEVKELTPEEEEGLRNEIRSLLSPKESQEES